VWYTVFLMAAKNPTEKRKASLDIILSTVERGFAAVAEDIADIKSRMATKDDLAVVNKTLDEHTKTLSDHSRDLATIKHDVAINLDKRLQLEVRVDKLEKKVLGAPR
jgi:hypothetical protein